MLLTGHKSRAIFDRYNIIHEQELLVAGDQLVAHLAQQAQAMPRGGRPHPARTAAPRTCGRRPGQRSPDTARLCAAARVRAHTGYEPASDRGTRGDGAGRRGQPRTRAGPGRASRPGGPIGSSRRYAI